MWYWYTHTMGLLALPQLLAEQILVSVLLPVISEMMDSPNRWVTTWADYVCILVSRVVGEKL